MGANDFTPRELELQALAWQCFEGEPKVNYKKLADLAGMGNPVSASNAWAKIKKKLAAQAAAASGAATADGSVSPKKSTPAATPKREKKTEAEGGDDEESPTKKARSTPKSGRGGKGRKKGADGGHTVQGENVEVKAEVEEDEFL